MEFFNWSNHIKTNFEEFKNNVISEMINLYGEEYKNYIIERLNRVNFIFYGNTSLTIPLYKQSKYEKQSIIYTTKPFKYSYPTKELIKKLANETSISHTTVYDYNDEDLHYFILFPLYSSDKQLIHEMIHAVTTDPIGITDNGKYISKVGIEITNGSASEALLEECITETEAKIIYNRLNKKNVESFIRDLDLNKFEHRCYYEHFIPLIIDFYNNHFNEITYSRFTMNKNKLFENVDKQEYMKLLDDIKSFEKELISKYEQKDNYKVKKLT